MQQLPHPPVAHLVFATPRKPPRAGSLLGRVAVVDLAFASEASGGGFEKTTMPLIRGLGARLAVWVDHHDHVEHLRFADDPRFVLSTKAQHPACPEMISPELVRRVGPVDTIVCHTDFDGLASAAKWMCGGYEPYPGCDADARAIDTRLGSPSEEARTIDRALRGRPRDHALFGIVVRHLVDGMRDASFWLPIRQAADCMLAIEEHTRGAARNYMRLNPGVALVDISNTKAQIDKTLLLMLGQAREPIAMVVDGNTINLASRFDSGINLLKALGLSGGMPTRVAVDRKQLPRVCLALGLDPHDVDSVLNSHLTSSTP